MALKHLAFFARRDEEDVALFGKMADAIKFARECSRVSRFAWTVHERYSRLDLAIFILGEPTLTARGQQAGVQSLLNSLDNMA